jgi:hypothetical protein
VEGLTTFLVVDFLEKQGISPELRKQIKNEVHPSLISLTNQLAHKGLFQSLVRLDGPPKFSDYDELKSQLPNIDHPILKNVIENHYRLSKEKLTLKSEKDQIIGRSQQKYDVFNLKKRRERTMRPKFKGFRYDSVENFPPELFAENWNRFKSMFGHLRRDLDPEDPISK